MYFAVFLHLKTVLQQSTNYVIIGIFCYNEINYALECLVPLRDKNMDVRYYYYY